MYIPKKYGQSKIFNCPFCGKQAIAKSHQGIPVCLVHKEASLQNLKCLCGEYLELKDGKYGPYFTCIKCGNINFKKALEINPDRNVEQQKSHASKKSSTLKYPAERKEITVRSDELDFLY